MLILGDQFEPISDGQLQWNTQSVRSKVIISNAERCQNQSVPYGYFTEGIITSNNSLISFYPNPFTDFILIQNLMAENEIEILNAQGQILFSKVSTNEKVTNNTSEFSAGMYLLKVKSKDEIINRVVVKN